MDEFGRRRSSSISSANRAPTSSRSSTGSRRCCRRLQASLPASVKVAVLTDRTTTIRASVADVEFELMLTVALVVMVIFLFLRSLSATIIPSIAVPLSLIGTFGVMYLLGYSLNNLTLMALTISTGFVVDDAIVMIENISRFIEEGEPPLQAALKGAEQIGFTILSLTISLIAVLIPLLFMGDIVGRLFREFAITLAVTILVSAVVSLTLTPMMSRQAAAHAPRDEQTRFYRASERAFQRAIDFYASTLRWVLKHQPATLMVAIATLVLTILLYWIVPKGFFPVQDTGVIQGMSEAPQSMSFPAMAQRQQALAQIILQDPAVESLSSFIGVDGTNTTPNSGRILINLKPLDERDASVSREIIDRLQPKLAQVEGITLYHAAGSGPDRRGSGQPHAISVQPRGSERRGAEHLDRDACRQAEGAAANCAMSRPTSRRRPARAPGDRSRYRLAPRHHAGDHRQHALRRLRAAPDLDDVHPAQPVPCGAGGRAASSSAIRASSTTSICAPPPADRCR